MRLLRAACFLAVTALLVSSCSGIIVYFIEKKISGTIDDTFDLEGKQEDWVEGRVSYHMSQFRGDGLKTVISIIDGGLKDYQDGLSTADIDRVFHRFRDELRPFIKEILLDVSTFLANLSNSQWQQFKSKETTAEDDKERTDDQSKKLTEAEQLNRILDKYRKLYGSLEPNQEKYISQTYLKNPEYFVVDQQITISGDGFAESVFGIVKQDLSPQQEREGYRRAFANPDQLLTFFKYDEIFEVYKNSQHKLVTIDGMMLPKQRQHFTEKWQDNIKTLKSYVRESEN